MEMMGKIKQFIKWFSTMKSNTRSGLQIGRILLVGEMQEKVGPGLNVWRISKKCG
jgi:hypothetical protein